MQAKSNIEFKYNGKVYQVVPETTRGSCKGCAFNDDGFGCAEAINNYWCNHNRTIWVEKQGDNKVDTGSKDKETVKESEPPVLTWTLDEIQQAYEDWDMYDGFSVLVRILRKQKQGQDPEYQKYLELKAKFGE